MRFTAPILLWVAAGITAVLAAGIAWHFFPAPGNASIPHHETAAMAEPAVATRPSPLILLKQSKSGSPTLMDWAERWDASPGRVPSDVELADLHTQIDASDLSAVTRLRIANALIEGKDVRSARPWTASGLSRAAVEWATVRGPALTVKTQWDIMAAAAAPFWVRRDRDILTKLLAVEALLPRRNDWDQLPEWHRINYNQVLLDLKDYAAALEQIQAVEQDSDAPWTAQHRTRLTLQEAQARSGLNQFAEAEQLLDGLQPAGDNERKAIDAALARVRLAKDEAATLTVLSVLQAHGNVPAPLMDWAQRWQAAPADDRPNDADTLGNLAPQIAASDLSASERLKVGERLNAAGDKASAATWFHAGVDQAKTDFDAALAKVSADDADTRQKVAQQVLAPILPKLDTASGMLWDAFDGVAQQKIAEMELLLPRVSPKDQRPEWMKIAHAEALYVQDRYQEAYAEVDAIVSSPQALPRGYNDTQRMEALYSKGLILNRLGRYEEACQYLQYVLSDAHFHHRDVTFTALIDSQLRKGEPRIAGLIFEQYRSEYQLNFDQGISLATRIETQQLSKN